MLGPTSQSGQIRVLCVAADPVCDRLQRELDRGSGEVLTETAPNARVAQTRLDGRLDCVVSEYELPEWNGVELLEAVREHYRELPFILFPDAGSESVASDAISAGVSDYVEQGAGQFEVLSERIRQHVEQSREYTKLEAHLRQAQAVADLGRWEFDPGEGRLYWSTEVAQLFGTDGRTSLRHEKFLEYVDPEDRARVAAEWNAALAGDDYDIEYRITTADEETRWVRDRADFIGDDEGTPEVALGVIQDVTERKERESQLQMQAEAMEASMEGISILSPDGEYVYMNEAHADIFGYDPEDLLGRSWQILYDDDEGARLERDALAAVAEAGEWRGEAVGRTRDGASVAHEVTISRLEDGRLIYTNSDITERKERERDLRRFKRAIEASSHSVYITNTDGTIEYVNPAFEETTGYAAEEAVGRTPRIVKSGEHDDAFYQQLWSTILGGETWHGELINRSKGGEQYVVNQTIAPVTDDDGETTHFVAINANITEMKEKRDELHQLRQAIDKAETPLTLTDPNTADNPMVYVNEAFKDLCGYSEDELLGQNCRMLQGPDTDQETVDALRRAVDEEEPITVEIRNCRKDGTLFWNELTVTPVYDTEGRLVRYLGTQREITDRKEREQHLQVLDRVLRHNLRNDMNVIQGLADTIRTDAADPISTRAESIIDKSEQLLNTAEKQRAITNVLLERPTNDPVEVDVLVERVIGMVEEEYPEASIAVDCSGERPVVPSPRIGLALEELVTNALEHSDRPAPTVEVSVTRHGEQIRIDVVDEGPRIPEMERQVSTQGEEVDPLYHGSGLGLWLVHWIVTRADGTVSFEQNEPRGNRVRIELPHEPHGRVLRGGLRAATDPTESRQD
ncbi:MULTISPECIES: PAS domain S-box protein [Halobellus]|uniref:PAS domain S-box protein n=1 Tax=Halobellus TaxID=1073986 RepID=UPI002114909F|nr:MULTISPECIES: PAS domain S-box protein [Halobellus]MDQ2055015.1 PAS domain S-box protein [Halobellus sp. H-GB7]